MNEITRRPKSLRNHYANRLGIATSYTALQAIQIRPEGDGGKGDELGFGTLTFTRDPLPTAGRPSGLTARQCDAPVSGGHSMSDLAAPAS